MAIYVVEPDFAMRNNGEQEQEAFSTGFVFFAVFSYCICAPIFLCFFRYAALGVWIILFLFFLTTFPFI